MMKMKLKYIGHWENLVSPSAEIQPLLRTCFQTEKVNSQYYKDPTENIFLYKFKFGECLQKFPGLLK